MTTTRSILASAALGLTVLGVAQSTAHAAEPTPIPHGDTRLDLSDQPDVAAGKCRWVKRIGVVCETENGTITL